MPLYRTLHIAIATCLVMLCAGCSSLGLSCFPSGHYLTDQAETVLDRSPRRAQLPRELDQGVMPAHYLQPGDVLLIEPVEFDSDVRLPADQQVLVDGSIDLGGFGRLVVAGLTLEMAENLIERTIVDSGRDLTSVNVRLLEPVHRYYVLGEVNSPGSYPLVGHETVLDGILAGGGLTSAAAPCKILLARPTSPTSCRITLPVCYREITQLGDTTTNYQLQPGDRIFVASRTWCEELMFWQATKTCSRCCDCQAPCADPDMVGYNNPVTHLPGDRLFSSAVAGAVGGTPVEIDLDIPIGDLDPAVRAADPFRAEATEPASPTRLPSAADGELEFAPIESTQRFEPLWITPTPEPSEAAASPAAGLPETAADSPAGSE